MVKFIIIGPLTRDRIFRKELKFESVGGAVYYQSSVFSGFGIDHTVLTTLAEKDKDLMDNLPQNTQIIPLYTHKTMEFENIYPDNNPNHRIQRASIPHNPVKPQDLSNINLKNYHALLLSPLSPYDIPLDTVEYLSSQDIPIYLGAQGYLRHVKNNIIVLKPWKNYKKFLDMVEFLFLDEIEARIILGNPDVGCPEIARKLSTYGPGEVIITRGERGALIYSKIRNKVYHLPILPPQKIVDPTGLGDTFMAAYAVKKLDTDDPVECGKFASRIASLKMGYEGAFRKNIIKKN